MGTRLVAANGCAVLKAVQTAKAVVMMLSRNGLDIKGLDVDLGDFSSMWTKLPTMKQGGYYLRCQVKTGDAGQTSVSIW